MTTQRNDGGPAFPVPEETAGVHADDGGYGHFVRFQGMTLRDYFAARAMASLVPLVATKISKEDEINTLCSAAYEWADAMLKAREK